MITNSWFVSTIIALVILVLVVWLLLYVCYSKAGRKAFSKAAIENVNHRIATTKSKLEQLSAKLIIICKSMEQHHQSELAAHLNVAQKAIVPMNKQLLNLENEKREQQKTKLSNSPHYLPMLCKRDSYS